MVAGTHRFGAKIPGPTAGGVAQRRRDSSTAEGSKASDQVSATGCKIPLTLRDQDGAREDVRG